MLTGPTGVGKTHIPKIYSFFTSSSKNKNGELEVG